MRDERVVTIVRRCIDGSPVTQGRQADISALKSGVAGLGSDVGDLRAELRRQSIMLDDLRSDVSKVIEVFMHHSWKLDELRALREDSERERLRLDALEDSVRRHVRDRRAHRSIHSAR